MKTYRLMKFQPKRTFGIELEFPEAHTREFLRDCIQAHGEKAQVTGFQRDANRERWTCKTDSSCGYEVASRILGSIKSIRRTIEDLNLTAQIVDTMKKEGATVNNKCGFHVHVWVGDMGEAELIRLLGYWVKFEKTIVDLMPERRKKNTYCPVHSIFFTPNTKYSFQDMVSRGFQQRGALNWAWYRERKTVEIRIAEGTTDPDDVQNWVRFLLHFVERCKTWPYPENVNWLTFEECLDLMGLRNDPEADIFWVLSPALVDMRRWLLERTKKYAGCRDASQLKGVVSGMLKNWYL